MNRSLPPLLMLACMISGCLPAAEQYTELETHIIHGVEAQSILIQVDYGEVLILESGDARVSVEGQVLFEDELEYLVNSTEKQISIKVFAGRVSASRVPLHLVIRVPQKMQVRVETDSASVSVQGFQGDVEVASTSGEITLERVSGGITLESNRGNITIRESSGTVSVVGNYGALTAHNLRGDVSISTIMGNIIFGGLIDGDDFVRLETDHGSVSVNLSADSSLTLQARSTSGDVACMLPNVESTTRTCIGEIHSGDGGLYIRTVSGAVILQLIP